MQITKQDEKLLIKGEHEWVVIGAMVEALILLVQTNNKIPGIKLVKHTYNVPLSDAANFMHFIEDTVKMPARTYTADSFAMDFVKVRKPFAPPK